MEFKHYSVLRDETIENLNIRPDGIYVDGTLGGAGHSYEIAKRLSDKGEADRHRSGCRCHKGGRRETCGVWRQGNDSQKQLF